MTLFWIAAALAALYVVYGLLAPNPFARAFAKNLPPDQNANGYLIPHEVQDADEDEIAQRLSRGIASEANHHQKNIAREDPLFHEANWGHTSGILRGTLHIDQIENLPEAFRVGLFAQAREYPVVARSNVTKDTDLGFAVSRLALKLSYPDPVPNVYAKTGEAHELDLLLVAGSSKKGGPDRSFFARDGRQLDLAMSLKQPSRRTLQALSNWRNIATLLGIKGTVKRQMQPMRTPPETTTGWAGRPYFSLGPFALGDGAMKFCLTPAQPHQVADKDPMGDDLAAFNKHNMDEWFAGGESAVFTLGVQLATPDCIPHPAPNDPPKSVMAAEYCDLQWDEDKSPYVPVGRLEFSPDASINTAEVWGGLQFNAWNTLPVMKPLGQMFRMRKHVHAAHSNARVAHYFGETPGGMTGKCPFAG